MSDHLTEDDILAAIPGLTRTRLVAFVETRMVMPVRSERMGVSALFYRDVDLARVRLLCDLAYDLELDDAAIDVVITLIDQLHATRQELLALTRAVNAEPPEVRARIGSAIIGS